jgi:hypothetical protein
MFLIASNFVFFLFSASSAHSLFFADIGFGFVCRGIFFFVLVIGVTDFWLFF